MVRDMKQIIANTAQWLQDVEYQDKREQTIIKVQDAVNLLFDGLNYFTNDKAEWLPEYDDVADWLRDNKGKGLLLMGACGRGKTLLCAHVIPTIINIRCGKNVRCFKPTELNRFLENKPIALSRVPACIDDVGTESIKSNNYGESRCVFSEIVDDAERTGRLLLITTNLLPDEIRERYGERTLDRLKAITRLVICSGESMRK